MKLLITLVATSIINFQQAAQPSSDEHTTDAYRLEQIATNFLKFRFSDADYIQATVVENETRHDYDVYLAFSAESTPVNTCQVHIHKYDDKKIQVKSISCINYQKKIGFKEEIHTTIYD